MSPAAVLALTGDLMLQEPLLRPDLADAAREAYALLRQADAAFVNLECPLTDRGCPADKLVTLRAPTALAGQLPAVGAGVVTAANNHALDYGLDGLFDTMQALSAAGVACVGIGADLDAALAPHILEAGVQRIAFLGVSCTLPPNAAAADERPGMAPIRVFTRYVVDPVTLEENPGIAPFVETQALEEDVTRVEAAVRSAARAADRVVVGIHWGVPHGWVGQFQDVLAAYQRPLAHRLVDAGADVVAGHHPHVLHGIEWYRDRPIFYSLGNFVFHRLVVGGQPALRRPFPPYSWRSLRSHENLQSVVAHVAFPAPGAGTGIRVEVFPVLLNARGEPERVQGEAGASVLRRLEVLSRPLGTRVEADAAASRAAVRVEEASA